MTNFTPQELAIISLQCVGAALYLCLSQNLKDPIPRFPAHHLSPRGHCSRYPHQSAPARIGVANVVPETMDWWFLNVSQCLSWWTQYHQPHSIIIFLGGMFTQSDGSCGIEYWVGGETENGSTPTSSKISQFSCWNLWFCDYIKPRDLSYRPWNGLPIFELGKPPKKMRVDCNCLKHTLW